ncbi:type I inositol polyphosphate 5-phosphatase 10 [Heracleum sosnowskyi]|uniref:Type I inositol polyphosphate 5-phosphatase 10 n=1 Tax=Heracleum sosnowskyi TaxID=360622 RepID=A0AAD8MI01_9APIA|nr:type I inositol polyphosphate 5-phosphatase 10 [Heracleum sosnowskyi]
MAHRYEEFKKSFIHKIFSINASNGGKTIKDILDSSDIHTESAFERSICKSLGRSMAISQDAQSLRVFAATWNVGGKSPHSGLNLDSFLQIQDQSDIYVLGFQEIVPLNAGNVLAIEDNGSAAKWLSLISQSLNKTSDDHATYNTHTTFKSKPSKLGTIKPITVNGGSLFSQKISLRTASRIYMAERRRRIKSCNCMPESERNTNQMRYSLIKSKQMVGIFVTIWVKRELVQHISHLRASCISRGILGYLGNKGCISVSMSVLQTSFCFVCSHLASGEKEGDELRRNSDVIEIIKNTQFPKICRLPNSKMPEKILEHDRIIWLGDLNYRIALSYSDTRKLLEGNNWDALLGKDQLKIEREAGRVFKGWKEGKIYFAPTYKYSYDSDTYAGETIKSKGKRRTPAWCDRILWHGNGIYQKSYTRWESRFSDHRPVCSTFLVNINAIEGEERGRR